jgi:HPt (histidine-containing phosphotransfer) domain-containing protein
MTAKPHIFEWNRPEPDRPLLDVDYLARLERHVGATVLTELLADGLIELTDRLARLGELAEAGDLDGIARLGHDLVGMAGHLGLTRLSATAAEMSRAARGRNGSDPAPVIAEAGRIGADSAAAVRRHLQEISSP